MIGWLYDGYMVAILHTVHFNGLQSQTIPTFGLAERPRWVMEEVTGLWRICWKWRTFCAAFFLFPRYGIHLWGMVLDREPLRELGTTMLTLCAMTIREFFLMKDDNRHHPADFATNHVTGKKGGVLGRAFCALPIHGGSCKQIQ